MVLKIVTINVNHGGEQITELEQFIRQENPDITFIQEAYNSQDRNSEQRLQTVKLFKEWMEADDMAFLAAYHDGDVDVDRGNAIISRFPIVISGGMVFNSPYAVIYDETSLGDWSDQPRVLQTASALIEGKQLHLINVHGIWDIHGKDSERRRLQSELILKLAKHKSPLIIAGDFNMNPDTQAIRLLEDKFIPVFDGELTTTFNMKKKSNPDFGRAVVDMMFVSEGITVVSKKCPMLIFQTIYRLLQK